MEQENFWYGELVKHLEKKEWSEVQITNLAMKVGRSTMMSCEAAVELLEYVQDVDQQIAEQKELEDLHATAPVYNREQALQLFEYNQSGKTFADAGWNERGEYTTFIPGEEI
jgi:hypothetical protein